MEGNTPNHGPRVGKGKKQWYTVCCAAWLDLLGYGTMLRAAAFDPTDRRAREAVTRLQTFHTTLAEAASQYLPIIAINDGALALRNLSRRHHSATFDFLARLVELHELINAQDSAKGFPGARMIIAVGIRMRYTPPSQNSVQRVEDILDRLNRDRISADQAVMEAFRARPWYGAMPELHANFAFTKAYLADEAGGRAGFAGPGCFVDLSMFDDPPPSWVSFARTFQWQTEGMSGRFGELECLDRNAAGVARHAGILNAEDIYLSLRQV